MSSELSFREQLERRADTSARFRDPSCFPTDIEIEIGDSFDAPVSLAIALRDNGLDLASAHAAVTELAERRRVKIAVFPKDVPALITELLRLGLVLHVDGVSA